MDLSRSPTGQGELVGQTVIATQYFEHVLHAEQVFRAIGDLQTRFLGSALLFSSFCNKQDYDLMISSEMTSGDATLVDGFPTQSRSLCRKCTTVFGFVPGVCVWLAKVSRDANVNPGHFFSIHNSSETNSEAKINSKLGILAT